MEPLGETGGSVTIASSRPGFLSNAQGIRLQAEQDDRGMASTILQQAFKDNRGFTDINFFPNECEKKENEQESENSIPSARSAMARWAWPILWASLAGIRESFEEVKEEAEKELKIKAIQDKIKDPLIKELASNYYHGKGFS